LLVGTRRSKGTSGSNYLNEDLWPEAWIILWTFGRMRVI